MQLSPVTLQTLLGYVCYLSDLIKFSHNRSIYVMEIIKPDKDFVNLWRGKEERKKNLVSYSNEITMVRNQLINSHSVLLEIRNASLVPHTQSLIDCLYHIYNETIPDAINKIESSSNSNSQISNFDRCADLIRKELRECVHYMEQIHTVLKSNFFDAESQEFVNREIPADWLPKKIS
jgi:hypothetical protein